MPRTLPTELLALVASEAAPSAQATLARTCRRAYTVAVQPLYASIGNMGTARTTRCLETLANNEHLARLVRIYAVKVISSGTLGAFQVLVTRALEQMENLVDLSIHLGVHATSAVLARARFRLTKLVCVVVSDPVYPVARFLESQPGIELLYLVCREDGLDTLASDALPALRDVAVPFSLIPHTVPTRLNVLARISILGPFINPVSISILATSLLNAPTRPALGTSVDLVIGINLSSSMTPMYIEAALSHLGGCAPWIGLLRLEIHDGRVSREILEFSITRALACFPNLHTLALISPIPPRAYTRPQPQVFPPPIPSIPPFPPYSLVTRPTSTSVPVPELDALHDATHHPKYLRAWYAVHPGLQRVVFPIGVYTYVQNKNDARYWPGKEGYSTGFRYRVEEVVKSVGGGVVGRGSGRRVRPESEGGVSFVR
ncbi:hypothetical protein BDV93DRAFT_565711 [Ceratobasidium sp. AG-I]|nr:hypothetical protein BDV93DRAFT_565711 [Ceratobasidium sp. AG-I]